MAESSGGRSWDLKELQAAVKNRRWDFRTVEGIAEELELAPSRIERMLAEHPEIVRRSILTDRRGRSLYTARDRRPTLRERIERFRSVL